MVRRTRRHLWLLGPGRICDGWHQQRVSPAHGYTYDIDTHSYTYDSGTYDSGTHDTDTYDSGTHDTDTNYSAHCDTRIG